MDALKQPSEPATEDGWGGGGAVSKRRGAFLWARAVRIIIVLSSIRVQGQ